MLACTPAIASCEPRQGFFCGFWSRHIHFAKDGNRKPLPKDMWKRQDQILLKIIGAPGTSRSHSAQQVATVSITMNTVEPGRMTTLQGNPQMQHWTNHHYK